MAGYTPVFDSVFDGTLCGRWPTLPVWLTILPMADKNGQIDMTYQAISAVSGWPLDLLKQAITELMEPDAESRTAAVDGRRLELIDPDNRQWGWRVVNHRVYREKARKQSAQVEAQVNGSDAERKRKERELEQSGADARCPALSGAVRPSDADSNSDGKKKAVRAPAARGARKCPADFQPDPSIAISEIPDIDADRELARFKDYEFKTPRSDWPATWRNWIRTAKDNGKYSKKKSSGQEWGRVT